MVTGTDYTTRDGTGLRDYIHVWDLALAHVRAMERFDEVLKRTGEPSSVINVGTGRGVTVRELIGTVERVLGRRVPVHDAPRRPGDVVGGFANVDKARTILEWSTDHTLEDGVRSALEWAANRKAILGYEYIGLTRPPERRSPPRSSCLQHRRRCDRQRHWADLRR
jgi:UDP-glucose 4-epimerase